MIRVIDHLKRVEGVQLAIRLVEPCDAAYIQGLRTDPVYSAHLSKVSGTVDDQRIWIETYKEREAKGLEYYYVIESVARGMPCGVVRLYDIREDSFTWGSWILDENKPRKAALESAVLSFGIGFDCLDRPKALIDVRRENHKALSFYRRLGMTQISADDTDIYFRYTANQYFKDQELLMDIVRRAAAA